MELKELYDGFRDPQTIIALTNQIKDKHTKLGKKLNIMEVCGGHTHTIVKYRLNELLKDCVEFVHGPGCPVCVMPKERIDEAYILSLQKDVILVTLGDMIKVPGSKGSLQQARSEGADVRFVYSPLDALDVAKKNPDKKVIFFAIGFETTTPMSADLVQKRIEEKVENLFFHINHVTVPEPIFAIMADGGAKIDAFIGPSHVSVITGSKIYEPIAEAFKTPIVACGFEPVDVLVGIDMIFAQVLDGRAEVEIEYKRSVTREGNLKAQELIDRYFDRREHFRWRGIGDIPDSAYKLRDEYAYMDAEVIYKDILPKEKIDDHKLCICGEILRGLKKPTDCAIFGKACTPKSPYGSCMVSSEGACSAYYKYEKRGE